MKMNIELTTDLYQLTMAAAYLKSGMADRQATFDLFVRSLPRGWNYLIACGVEEALEVLADFRFLYDEISFLRAQGFDHDFCDYLMDFRFRGRVRGLPEGTPFFPNEPILEVTGNIIEAQVVETILLSLINYQTLIASKASRVVEAARPAQVVDFGLRRAPGPEAGIRAARAAYIAGVAATSNVEAGRIFNIPIKGTHAHSFIMSHETELDAFKAWCAAFPKGTSLLIDTYDVEEGARNVVRAVESGCKVTAVRIDSGDLAENAKLVRSILDSARLSNIEIIVSGDLNEERITALKGAPIDGYGVGTEMVTARPEAALGGVYKLVEVDGRPTVKLSRGKETWPGKKQIWRYTGSDASVPCVDVLAAEGEDCPVVFLSNPGEWMPLMETFMENGMILSDRRPFLSESRRRCGSMVAQLPEAVKSGERKDTLFVSPAIQEKRDRAVAKIREAQA